jgi:aspartyl-tRNA(Asn)/glutamyl-tRNA(Gln) amidotransferase subunit C
MQSTTETGNPSRRPALAEPVPLEQVLRVAELAQLELTSDEQQGMLRDLNAILGHVAQLNELDTTDVPPMTQVKDILRAPSASEGGHTNPTTEEDAPSGNVLPGNVLREDRPVSSLQRDRALAAAPETDGTYFKVPKVIER